MIKFSREKTIKLFYVYEITHYYLSSLITVKKGQRKDVLGIKEVRIKEETELTL